MPTSRVLLAVAAASAALGCAAAQAAVIPGLFNTGVDDNGLALIGGAGVVDTHYRIHASTLPAEVGTQAVTYMSSAYVGEDANSRWIAYATQFEQVSNTVTTYRLSFDLAGLDAGTAQISGRWGADNSVRLFLKGIDTGQTTNRFDVLTNFAVASGFQAGMNHLDFVVTDGTRPTGLRVDDFAGVADVLAPPPTGAVPEPAAWAMMIMGFTGVGALMRRRRVEVFA